ncbi:Glycosyltransferase involved in cell wall bisynthesis (RfaB) (PDB:2IV7) [Commensalibacter communis]|uniref:glycosyltransferase n=1 Tax=Commensalibacter communis TaxID=2972786 RepID=UPI0022FF6667|nr:glycosyltransferase [Commensalibacter communis]CAI3944519.1 Glycosyltransferase involved in cell wall bisynthesis (RfaB) (PDB:2IV7) [Commensalibacter communis]CAI3945834.1 Glycosyltransferase involved in cell wall bisynthesis (RfaB) (PDB:2IV7) [Commensalibacter communis]
MNKTLIITPNIDDSIHNGDIGTAFTSLSHMLVSAEHSIDILYVTPASEMDNKPIEYWGEIYKENNINFIPLDLPNDINFISPHFRNISYLVYLWLKKNNNYQTIISCERQAQLYYSLLAKKHGLNFLNTSFVINTQGSTLWANEGNYQLPSERDHIELYFMEQKVVEMADEVISSSQYLLNWMTNRKWKLPKKSQVILNCERFLPEKPNAPENKLSKESYLQSKKDLQENNTKKVEIVFFGHLETAKGLDIFLKSLELLTLEQLEAISRITFLGKNVGIQGVDSVSYINDKIKHIQTQISENINPTQLKQFLLNEKKRNTTQRADKIKNSTGSKVLKLDLTKRINILNTYNRIQAYDYIQKKNVLVVIPSLVENSPYTIYECLLHKINFIAADVGGIPELIKQDQRENVLFKTTPVELYKKLSYRLISLRVKSELVQDLNAIHQTWLKELSKPVTALPSLNVPTQTPEVSVCLTHYNRPKLLKQAITSLQNQTYENFEVILVDDGSRGKETHQYLDSIQPYFNKKGWKIIKSTNNYLGAARNLAARHAQGEYLLFMDDDNVAKPHEITTFVQAALNSKCDILTTPSEIFYSTQYPSDLEETTTYWLPMGGDLNTGSILNCFGDANAFIKKQVFDDLEGFTEDYGVGHEDWEFFAKAVSKGYHLEVVPESLFYYRVLSTGMFLSGDNSKNLFRSYRPFIDPDGKTSYVLGLVPALYDKIVHLENELNRCKPQSQYNEIYAIKRQLNNLFSQQKEGWANDRFNILNEKIDTLLSERKESVTIDSLNMLNEKIEALTSQQREGWANDRFSVLNEKIEALTSQQREGWASDRFNVLNEKIEALTSQQREGWANDRFNVLNEKIEALTSQQRANCAEEKFKALDSKLNSILETIEQNSKQNLLKKYLKK